MHPRPSSVPAYVGRLAGALAAEVAHPVHRRVVQELPNVRTFRIDGHGQVRILEVSLEKSRARVEIGERSALQVGVELVCDEPFVVPAEFGSTKSVWSNGQPLPENRTGSTSHSLIVSEDDDDPFCAVLFEVGDFHSEAACPAEDKDDFSLEVWRVFWQWVTRAATDRETRGTSARALNIGLPHRPNLLVCDRLVRNEGLGEVDPNVLDVLLIGPRDLPIECCEVQPRHWLVRNDGLHRQLSDLGAAYAKDFGSASRRALSSR